MTTGSEQFEQDDEGNGFSLSDLIGLARRRCLLIACIATVITTVVATVAYLLPSRYEAVATVQIDPRKKTIVNLDNVVSDLRTDPATVESEVEVLRSKSLALKVIDILDLRNNAEFTKTLPIVSFFEQIGLMKGAQPKPYRQAEQRNDVLGSTQEPGRLEPQRDEMLHAFDLRLKAQRVRTTLLIEVRFTATNPTLAARVVNTLLEVYLKEQLDSKSRATEQATNLLEGKLDSLRQKVYEAERKVAAYKADNNIFDAEGQLLSEKQLARLMEQTVVARNHSAEAKARYEEVQRLLKAGESKSAIADVLPSGTVRLLKDNLAKASRHEAELLTKYGPKHPDLLKVRAEVADTQKQLSSEVDQIVANLRNEYRISEERERALASNLGALKEQQVISKDAGVRLNELEREAQSSKQVFEAFLARYKQTAETQDLQTADSRIVERADVPVQVSWPKRRPIAFLGLLAGLLLGFGIAFMIELSAPGLTKPQDVQDVLGMTHLASMPNLRRLTDGLRDPSDATRVVIVKPNGIFAEAIRSIQHEIDISRKNPDPRIILVMSTLPNEGKTLIAANLAHHLAKSGTRTLLIDADIRRSTLSQQLGVGSAAGLVDAIASSQLFEAMILRDPETSLAVLPAGGVGRISISPVDLLSAPGFGQRLERLRGYFDTIIVDSPPLLAVVDARIIADHADQILMVTAWRRTPRQLIRKALRLLGSNVDKLVGVVMNQVELPDSNLEKRRSQTPRVANSDHRRAA